MKKYLFNTLCILAFWAVSTPALAEDCSVIIGAARILYQQQKWEIAKMECEAYLKECGYNAEVQQILNACDQNLKGSAPAPVTQSSSDEDEEELSLPVTGTGTPTPTYAAVESAQ